ncbi:MAG: DUF2520 domain-containing protein [Deltaproteobacteria bacterium]|nr:DUF2520 domain-containing protein [Deltaproteobacteria bacterium]MDQ3295893.1 DUF2520 domain-containing protein [Myxococcota bacterium]
MTARNPTTFLVGAGPVATALAGALRLGGVPVLGLWARRAAQARAAGSTAGVAAFSSAPPDILLETEIVILAVRDQQIGEVAEMLVGTGLIGKRHVLLHCAGAASAQESLGAVASAVAGVGTLHPLSAIADGKLAMRALKGTVFGVEGDAAGRAAASKLVAAMGGVVLALDSSQMGAYHAAAAVASNYVVAALDAAAAILASAGVAPEQAAQALVPLAEGALRNITARGTTAGLTGPVRRGDAETIQRHLDALRGKPELAEIYRTLARRAVEIASRIDGQDAPDRAGLDAIRKLLDAGA